MMHHAGAHASPNHRNARALRLTPEEAFELHDLGFRFAVFRPGVEEFQLSLPLETVIDIQAETLTIRQTESSH